MKSMRTVALTLPILAAGCVAQSTGGGGFLENGKAVVAEAHGGGEMNFTQIRISSAEGWVCEGSYKHAALAGHATVDVPLNCNDGGHGNGILSVNQFQGQARIVFHISGGRNGYADFGQT